MWGNMPYLREDDTDLRKASNQKAAVGDRDPQGSRCGDREAPRHAAQGTGRSRDAWTAKAYKGKRADVRRAVRRRARDAA